MTLAATRNRANGRLYGRKHTNTLDVMIALMLGVGLLSAPTYATTWIVPPASLREQIEAASHAGEFEVSAVTTVVLEDGFPTTHVELMPVRRVGGDFATGTLILPGGVVDGEFRRPTPDAFEVGVGDVLFLMLEPATRSGYYNIAHGFPYGFFRKVQHGGVNEMEDSTGRLVVEVSCGSERAVRQTSDQVPLTWEGAVNTLISCGGAR